MEQYNISYNMYIRSIFFVIINRYCVCIYYIDIYIWCILYIYKYVAYMSI